MIRTAAFFGASLAALALATPAIAQDEAHDDHDHAGVHTFLAEADTATPATAAAVPVPTMSFGSWGVDPKLLSATVHPGDDFFAYVNKPWLDANPLPPEFSRFGAFTLLSEKSTSDVKALMDELVAKPATSRSYDERRIVDAYKAYLDTAAIEQAGMAPAMPYLDRIRTATTLDALVELWAEPGLASPIGGGVSVDAKQPDRHIAYLSFGGLGLPDRDYYLDESEKGRAIQTQYKAYLAFLLGEAGYTDATAAAEAVYALEDRIARTVAWDRTVQRNRDLTYNLLTADDVAALPGSAPLVAMLAKTG
ncbi:MAG TPA: M13 family metallopeptidase N-terminal domain-containing protein, partial [Erythrobacter sp.]|nr:M13 family metallopeptidase N-terminal domain-containing protein [Erythrobacter sp.]